MELQADCSRCVALCCVAPAFTASADFAIDKPAGHACPNLRADFGCGIHAELRPRGFAGCTVYDCYGAGQHLTQWTYAGRSWRDDAQTAKAIFEAFALLRQLHELAWLLTEAVALAAESALVGQLSAALAQVERLSDLPADALPGVEVGPVRERANLLLVETSEQVRRVVEHPAYLRGADLVGADLHGRDLRGANLRGALLVGADLREADLRLADLTGADLRGADLRGTDISTSLFVTQSQLDSAQGDTRTQLPEARRSPDHWPSRDD